MHMEVKHISFEELKKLLGKTLITQDERFLIDSYVTIPLTEYCNDLRSHEIEKVRYLEEKNIYRYLNTYCIILGLYGQDTLSLTLTTYPISVLYQELKNQYHGRELEKNIIFILTKALLALKEKNSSQILKPHFEGEMPQKFMSFRNQTANEWFDDFVNSKLVILSTIYEKSSFEETKAHLFASIAYQLNRNNPAKYHLNADIPLNDALKNILMLFIKKEGGDSSIIYSKSGEILSKIL